MRQPLIPNLPEFPSLRLCPPFSPSPHLPVSPLTCLSFLTSPFSFLTSHLSFQSMKHTVTLIPGDRFGPGITAATVRIIEATGIDVGWETHIMSTQVHEKYWMNLQDETIK